MPSYVFKAYEVDHSYYHSDARSPILSRDTLTITDGADGALHRSRAEDPDRDQSFDFANEAAVTDYTVQYLDFAQLNGSGPDYELYAMQVRFADGTTKYYVMSKDEGFRPEVGDDLAVTSFSNFTSTSYGDIGAVVCYATGTPIQTERGACLVERLRPGDRVQTADNGCREVLWMGRRCLGRAELAACPQLRPVLIRPGPLGNSAPLLVSPQHRMLIRQAQTAMALPAPEVFVRARHLAEYCGPLARIAHGKREIGYHHILLERHEVIFAAGARSESLCLGKMALRGISRADRRQIESLFPALAGAPDGPPAATARPVLGRRWLDAQDGGRMGFLRAGTRAAAA